MTIEVSEAMVSYPTVVRAAEQWKADLFKT